jgi:hypothetical protein
MLKKILTAAGFASLLLGAGPVLAAGPVHFANDESGSVYHGAEYAKIDGRLTRVDKWNAPSAFGDAARLDDKWAFAGEEAGWQLRQHSYDFVGGRLVHSDNIGHDAPRPNHVPHTGAAAAYQSGG